MRVPRWFVEVEPLSDARWARVERELFATLDESTVPELAVGRPPARRARVLGWAAFAAVLAVATASFALLAHRPTRADDRSTVHATRWDDRSSLATTDSASQFTVGESLLTVAPRSLVIVSGDDDQGVDVVLDRGTVTCEVAPRRGRPAFRVEAGEVRVRVTGTKFTVTRDDGLGEKRDEAGTSVDVERGSVEVTARGVVTIVQEGGHWPTRFASALAGLPDLVGTSPSGTEAALPAVPSPTRSPARRRPRGHASTAPTVGPDPGASQPAASQSAPSVAPPVAPASQQAFEAAARIERSNPAAAAAAYGELADGATAWAPNALFALARLEADRGHRAEAVRLFDAYLARYPRGINAADARELLRRMQ